MKAWSFIPGKERCLFKAVSDSACKILDFRVLFTIKHILLRPGNSSSSKTMSQVYKSFIILKIVRLIWSNFRLQRSSYLSTSLQESLLVTNK